MIEGVIFPRKARGRPARTSEQLEATRSRIVAVAEMLFRREGYGSVSMRRIAAECGCTTATLYAYFDAKIVILRRLWSGIFDELFSALAAAEPQSASPRERLRHLAAYYVRYWIANPDRYRLVFMSDGIVKADVDAFLADNSVVARFVLLREAMAAALLTTRSQTILKRKAEVLICVLHGAAHNFITMGGYPWSDVDEIIDEALEGLLR